MPSLAGRDKLKVKRPDSLGFTPYSQARDPKPTTKRRIGGLTTSVEVVPVRMVRQHINKSSHSRNFLRLVSLLCLAVVLAACAKPPVPESQSVVLQEDTTIDIELFSQVSNGAEDSYEVTVQPRLGNLTGTPPNLTYTPQANVSGEDSFSFAIVDASGSRSESATVDISIQPVNDPPIVQPLELEVLEDGSVDAKPNANDIDGFVLQYELLSPPKNGTVSLHPTGFTYIPDPNFNGKDNFTFVAVDNEGAKSEPASVEISAYPQGGTLSGSGSVRTYTPRTDFHGTDTFQFTVTDNLGQKSQPAVISIEVEPKNDPPTVESSHLFTAEDSRGLKITLQGYDPDGQIERFKIVRSPRHGRLRRFGDQWEYTPSRDFWGDDSFDFVAIDDEGLRSHAETVTIEVVESPDPPSISTRRRSYETHVGETIDLDVRVSDPDGDARWFSVQDRRRGANGRFFPSSGRVRSLRDLRFEATRTGSYSYRLEVEDDKGLKDWTTLTIHVRNSPPRFEKPKPRYDKKKGAVEFTLRVRDPDGRVQYFVIETIDECIAESIVVRENGTHEIAESVPFSTGGDCEEEYDTSCSLKVTYTPDEIDGHSRRIRFYAVDNEGDVSRKDFIRIETRELQ